MSHVPITVRVRRPVNFGMTGLRRHQTDQKRLPDTGTVPLVRGEAGLFDQLGGRQPRRLQAAAMPLVAPRPGCRLLLTRSALEPAAEPVPLRR